MRTLNIKLKPESGFTTEDILEFLIGLSEGDSAFTEVVKNLDEIKFV